jgi:shikimate dehydrogenase
MAFILGHPVSHSLSPLMHNAAFRHLGLPWLYVPLDLTEAQLGPFLGSIRDLPVVGGNVTVPYKGSVLRFLDGVSSQARRLGSVNTIHRSGKRWLGASTDGEGFLRSLGPLAKGLRGSRGIVLGAGGAGRAVAFALAGRGVRSILIANRSSRPASGLAREVRSWRPSLDAAALSLGETASVLPRCDWVVQATSMGLGPGDPSPMSLAGARPTTWVVDLIYHRTTRFLSDARRRGLVGLDGKGMLLHQGALSFELWTGRKAPLAVMRASLRDGTP